MLSRQPSYVYIHIYNISKISTMNRLLFCPENNNTFFKRRKWHIAYLFLKIYHWELSMEGKVVIEIKLVDVLC